MATQDTCCSILPYFKIHQGKTDAFKALAEKFVSTTKTEPKCLYYGFCFDGDTAHCREGYADAEALLEHLGNVDELLKEAFKIADVTRVEIQGPEDQLAKLREPLAPLNPQFLVHEYGFRN